MSLFRAEILAHGMRPPCRIEPGRFHRFPGIGKKPTNTAGWCCLFQDGQGGVFGDFASGLQLTWRDKDGYPDKKKWLAEVRAAGQQARAARQADCAKTAKKAQRIWNQSEPAQHHPYLSRKAIEAHGVRVDCYDNLVIPIYDGEALTSLQFIKPDGTKRFLKGGKVADGSYRIGEVAETLLLCEGFATGVTLHEETGHAVVCAFNAGNLVEVARQLHERFPCAEIIVCGDNDHATSGNPGKTMAQKAATAAGGKWVVPDFTGLNAGPKDTDFNDLARLTAKAGAAWA
jgi:putative DNA primase/helicase